MSGAMRRASGWRIVDQELVADEDGRSWASLSAERDGVQVRVLERIEGPGDSSWTDPSLWWWQSEQGGGPWWAVTRIITTYPKTMPSLQGGDGW